MNSRGGSGLLRIHSLDQHFTHVNPDPIADRMTFWGKSSELRLNPECELDRIRRFAEDDEKRASRRFDLLAFGKTSQDLADNSMVPLNEVNRFVIPENLLELGRANNICEEESDQANTMLAPELFHANPWVWGNRRVHDKRRLPERYGRHNINWRPQPDP